VLRINAEVLSVCTRVNPRLGVIFEHRPRVALGKIVDDVLAVNPKQVRRYKGGKRQVIGFLAGQVMKAGRRHTDPAVVNQLIKEKL